MTVEMPVYLTEIGLPEGLFVQFGMDLALIYTIVRAIRVAVRRFILVPREYHQYRYQVGVVTSLPVHPVR